MSAEKKPAPIIIRRKSAGHGGGHHGGAWKVAYADFVTAMMAFFMVMWILGMDQGARDLIEGYFTNPAGFKKAYGGGKSPLSAGNAIVPITRASLTLLVRESQASKFKEIGNEIHDRLGSEERVRQLAAQVEISVDAEGLRIELLEKDRNDSFFLSGSPQLRPEGARVLQIIGNALAGLPQSVIIEGHTDASQFGGSDYTNWELSTERANAARRVLDSSGVYGRRILEVRGYADRKPRLVTDPLAPSNRRVTILLPYNIPLTAPLTTTR